MGPPTWLLFIVVAGGRAGRDGATAGLCGYAAIRGTAALGELRERCSCNPTEASQLVSRGMQRYEGMDRGGADREVDITSQGPGASRCDGRTLRPSHRRTNG